MPGVAILEKASISKKSNKKANKNTKFIEQKTTVAKLDHTNESEPNAFSKQVFNSRCSYIKAYIISNKNIQKSVHKNTKIKREIEII